jgi:hypothetical protein
MESDLLKALEHVKGKITGKTGTAGDMPGGAGRGQTAPTGEPADTLKGQLMRLMQEVSGIQAKKETTDPVAVQKLIRLAEFTEAFVKTVEAQQIVNTVLQESDNRFLLQIPLLFPGGLRMGELYVEKDVNPSKSEGKKDQYRVVFFLDMDAMGMVMIDASIRDRTVGCAIKCEHGDIRDFMAAHLPELEQSLLARGYQVDYMTCGVENSLGEEKRNYMEGQGLYSDDLVNLFA